MRQRHRSGSVVLDKRIRTWNFFFWENGRRRSKKIGTLAEHPTKAAAWRAAKPLRDAVENQVKININRSPNVSSLIEQYRAEKMPTRHDTRGGYESWLRVYIIPKWAKCSITDLQARTVELWLESLPLAPKSKVHIRGILSALWNYAMWKQDVPMQVNPISLVTIKGASKRVRKPRSLTVEEFRKLIAEAKEPARTVYLLCVCFGLRISECLALKWSDIDWLNATLRIERGIVQQVVDDVKSEESRKTLTISADLLDQLKLWKQTTQFSANEDWIFASPVQLGRLPYSYTGMKQELHRAAEAAGIGKIGTHTMRHTYRTWLDSVGTPVGVQQRLMRHSDVRLTLNHYGDAMTPDMREASGKVAMLALNGR